jgi:pimeloyl-ACP methyl ester carboxylesterase
MTQRKTRLKDMIVILPGITGSVLQVNGEDVWGISGQSLWSWIRSRGDAIRDLALTHDDPEAPSLGDGVIASGVMKDFHLVPGIIKIVDGYSGLRDLFTDRFQIIRGHKDSDEAANYFEFAYDWRRDNRASAHRLKELINRALPRWREKVGTDDARVILVAHSMGGLVSRYYLENLDGWRDCRALITFGTPYRGSLNAVNFLANGYKKMFLDLTDVMRSFTSMYQLLPIYEAIYAGSKYQRVAEIDGIPGIDLAKAQDGLRFHREIEDAVNAHRDDKEYRNNGYTIIPVVGTREPTFQSAVLEGKNLTVSRDTPDVVPHSMSDGDGTVPRVSAIPIELSMEYRETFVAQKHGALQADPTVLDQLYERIKQIQVAGRLPKVRGGAPGRVVEAQAALSVDMDDFYNPGDVIDIRAEIINQGEEPGRVEATITPRGTPGNAEKIELTQEDGTWRAQLGSLTPGVYEIEIATRRQGPYAPGTVRDLFEVGDAS